MMSSSNSIGIGPWLWAQSSLTGSLSTLVECLELSLQGSCADLLIAVTVEHSCLRFLSYWRKARFLLSVNQISDLSFICQRE